MITRAILAAGIVCFCAPHLSANSQIFCRAMEFEGRPCAQSSNLPTFAVADLRASILRQLRTVKEEIETDGHRRGE